MCAIPPSTAGRLPRSFSFVAKSALAEAVRTKMPLPAPVLEEGEEGEEEEEANAEVVGELRGRDSPAAAAAAGKAAGASGPIWSYGDADGAELEASSSGAALKRAATAQPRSRAAPPLHLTAGHSRRAVTSTQAAESTAVQEMQQLVAEHRRQGRTRRRPRTSGDQPSAELLHALGKTRPIRMGPATQGNTSRGAQLFAKLLPDEGRYLDTVPSARPGMHTPVANTRSLVMTPSLAVLVAAGRAHAPTPAPTPHAFAAAAAASARRPRATTAPAGLPRAARGASSSFAGAAGGARVAAIAAATAGMQRTPSFWMEQRVKQQARAAAVEAGPAAPDDSDGDSEGALDADDPEAKALLASSQYRDTGPATVAAGSRPATGAVGHLTMPAVSDAAYERWGEGIVLADGSPVRASSSSPSAAQRARTAPPAAARRQTTDEQLMRELGLTVPSSPPARRPGTMGTSRSRSGSTAGALAEQQQGGTKPRKEFKLADSHLAVAHEEHVSRVGRIDRMEKLLFGTRRLLKARPATYNWEKEVGPGANRVGGDGGVMDKRRAKWAAQPLRRKALRSVFGN